MLKINYMTPTRRTHLYVPMLMFAIGLTLVHVRQPRSVVGSQTSLAYPGEKHLRNIRQLTFGGQNAEAYWSADDKYLIFQHQGEGVPCDQIYTIAVDTRERKPAIPKLVSTGQGRTTCSYFF
ncbi:MAG TPA: hypothetical protein VKD24_00350, partial [Candidatus Angelobacter sp.]|nr:hypothetical protein [Candidatus Angelobacter sp.]